MTAFWLDAVRRPRAEPSRERRRRRLSRRRGGHGRPRWSGDARASRRDAADRVHRARLPVGLGVGGVPQAAARCTARRCRRDCEQSAKLPEPVFTPSTKADVGHDENICFEAAVELVGDKLAAAARELSLAAYERGASRGRGARHHHRRHQVRARHHRRRAGGVRRSAHARLVALLAGRRVAAGHDAAVVRQAAAARLARGDGMGQEPAAAHAAARSRRRDRASVTSTATSGSPAVRSPTGRGCRRDQFARRRRGAAPRPGIADPQGATIERSLPALGFGGVAGVRVGKCIRFDIEAGRRGSRPASRSRTVRAVSRQPGDRRHGGRPSCVTERGRWRESASSSSPARTASSMSSRPSTRSEATASSCGTATRRLAGVDAVVVAGRLRPRRLPAPRRHRPVLADHGRGRRVRACPVARCVGICNGFQVLTEAGLLPGALQKNRGPQVPVHHRRARAWRPPIRRSPRDASPVRDPAHPDQPLRRQLHLCADDAWPSSRPTIASFSRYVDNPNGSMADIAGICNDGRNVVGLMPHPERASDALLGSTDGACCCGRCWRSPRPAHVAPSSG